MKKSDAEMLAKRICDYYENRASKDEAKTRRHFEEEGFPKTTVWNILKRCINRNTTKHLPKSGRPKTISTDDFIEDVRNLFESKPDVSVRTAADQLSASSSTLQRIKKKTLGLNAYTKQFAPKYRDGQELRAKRGCGTILYLARNKKILMDDETYVVDDPAEMPGKEFYHATSINNVDQVHKFKRKQKFPRKFLIWQLIDSSGNVSVPYVTTGTMNGKIYLNECIKKRLWPFIQKYHPELKILFWPDMARCHYAKDVTNWLQKKKIEFVQERCNAPNVPQARPIEKFWALCKREYKKLKIKPKSVRSFARQWHIVSKNVAKKSLKKLMRNVRKKLRIIRDGSVLDAIN